MQDVADDEMERVIYETLMAQMSRSVPIILALGDVLSAYKIHDIIPALGIALALQAHKEEDFDEWLEVLRCYAKLQMGGALPVTFTSEDTTYQ